MTSKNKAKHSGKQRLLQKNRQPASDKTIYFGLLIIGVFSCVLLLLLVGGEYLLAVLLAWFVIIAWHVISATIAAYQGKSQPHWKQALARLPLRIVGYGRAGGKPIEAAHNRPETMRMLVISIVIALAIIAIMGFFVLRRFEII